MSDPTFNYEDLDDVNYDTFNDPAPDWNKGDALDIPTPLHVAPQDISLDETPVYAEIFTIRYVEKPFKPTLSDEGLWERLRRRLIG